MVNMNSSLEKLLVTILKVPCALLSLTVGTDLSGDPGYWKLSSFVAKENFSTSFDKAKIPPFKLNETFMKAFRNFNCFSCFWELENARMCTAGIQLSLLVRT